VNVGKKLLQNNLAAEIADDRAVFRSNVVDVIGCENAPGSSHIVNDNSRIAKNMFVKVAADHTRISIVTAAGGKPDNDANGLTLVKIRNRFLVKANFRGGGPGMNGRSCI
jgi:hypothetical protein